jgi:hypothetical protein
MPAGRAARREQLTLLPPLPLLLLLQAQGEPDYHLDGAGHNLHNHCHW